MSDSLVNRTRVENGAQAPRADDNGRNINPELGVLRGEGSQQVPLGTRRDVELHSQAFPYVPSRQPGETPAYYDYPMLKQPVWIWSIPAYLYVGGVAGVSATFGAAVQLTAPDNMRSLVTTTRWIATAGGAVSAALLVHDLGRPERFLHMLRVFRVTSPMSMGSWILSAFSTFAGGAAVLPFGPKLFRPLAGVCGAVAGVLGLGLSGYTGVLLAQTAVPVWRQTYRTLPVLFLASGSAAAASFLDFFTLNEQESRAVERFGTMGKAVELAAAFTFEAEANQLERVGRPLKEGLSGTLWQTSKALTIASAVISLLPGKGRKKRALAGLLGSAASLCLRFGVFYAGKASARDPRASFEQQRRIPAAAASLPTSRQALSRAPSVTS